MRHFLTVAGEILSNKANRTAKHNVKLSTSEQDKFQSLSSYLDEQFQSYCKLM